MKKRIFKPNELTVLNNKPIDIPIDEELEKERGKRIFAPDELTKTSKQENEGLQKVWNTPMAGFYTYGEYGKGLNGKHEFHSTTCSWVVLNEK